MNKSDAPKPPAEPKAEMAKNADNADDERPIDWEKVKESKRMIRVFCEHRGGKPTGFVR